MGPQEISAAWELLKIGGVTFGMFCLLLLINKRHYVPGWVYDEMKTMLLGRIAEIVIERDRRIEEVVRDRDRWIKAYDELDALMNRQSEAARLLAEKAVK